MTLPLHIALCGAQPADQLRARLQDLNGTTLEQPIEVVVGNDGVGYAVHNLAWAAEAELQSFEPGAATFEIVLADGTVLKQVPVRLLPESDTQLLKVAWLGSSEDLIVVDQAVPATPRVGAAALQELLNGPIDGNVAGATTALPTVHDIVTFPRREADWGYEVKLLDLTISDGIATTDFSKEMRAYGGGMAQAQAIRRQIEATLKQFPSIQEVVIQVEGQNEDMLQP